MASATLRGGLQTLAPPTKAEVSMGGEERESLAQTPRGTGRGGDPRMKTRLDGRVRVAPGVCAAGERLSSTWIPGTARSGSRGSCGWCGAWSLQLPHPREPPAHPGTWLGRIVHDSDESFSQEVVVSGFLGRSGHWKLDSLEFLRIHAWNREKGPAVSAATLPCPGRPL